MTYKLGLSSLWTTYHCFVLTSIVMMIPVLIEVYVVQCMILVFVAAYT